MKTTQESFYIILLSEISTKDVENENTKVNRAAEEQNFDNKLDNSGEVVSVNTANNGIQAEHISSSNRASLENQNSEQKPPNSESETTKTENGNESSSSSSSSDVSRPTSRVEVEIRDPNLVPTVVIKQASLILSSERSNASDVINGSSRDSDSSSSSSDTSQKSSPKHSDDKKETSFETGLKI